MELRVLFFGAARTAVACHEATVRIERSPLNANELWDELVENFPALEPLRSSTRMARNHEYLPMDGLVSYGDEIALIPPVSGG